MQIVVKMHDKDRAHQLIILLKQGNKAAYLELYDIYKVLLHEHACKRLGNADDADDIVQELFIHLWENRESIEVSSSVTGYLYTAVRNRIFNHFVKKDREASYLSSLADFINRGEYSTERAVRERELEKMIEHEVNMLPKRMREVFMLSRNAGLSHKEISEHLGTSEQTISKQISNTLKILRIKLDAILLIVLAMLLSR